MVMWLRLAAAVVATLVAMGVLEYFGASSILGGRSDDIREAAHSRTRELFWFMVFAIVMATALLAAARRGVDQLRRAVAPARR